MPLIILQSVGTKLGVAGLAIGEFESVIAVSGAIDETNSWDDPNTTNAIATVLCVAAISLSGPAAKAVGWVLVLGGLVGASLSSSGINDYNYEVEDDYTQLQMAGYVSIPR